MRFGSSFSAAFGHYQPAGEPTVTEPLPALSPIFVLH